LGRKVNKPGPPQTVNRRAQRSGEEMGRRLVDDLKIHDGDWRAEPVKGRFPVVLRNSA